jgi:hypothetical protein
MITEGWQSKGCWPFLLLGQCLPFLYLDQHLQLEIGLLKLDWTDLQLSRWRDRKCRQKDITQPVLLEFCRKVVAGDGIN